MKTFKKKITSVSYIWLVVSIAIIFGITYDKNGTYFSQLIFSALLAAVWFFTFQYPTYRIDQNKLIIKTLFEKNLIEVSSIRKIEKDQISIHRSIFRPAEKGIRVHYNKFDDIILCPKNEAEFINALLQNNPNIEIVDKKA